jgi:hypothetical protein
MGMAGEWSLVVVGAVLLLAAALATRRGRAGDTSRAMAITAITAASCGALCVAAGVILVAGGGSTASSGSVRVTIGNELSKGQVSEEIRIFLDDRAVGVLRVDRRTPKAQLSVTLAHKGRYRYRLVSTRMLEGQVSARRTSRGRVVIDSSRPLLLYADDRGRVYLM